MANEERWTNVVVLGAAGKMGSGIALLLLQEMADMATTNLILVDVNDASFVGLRRYLRAHLLKYAEKSIVRLRQKYIDRSDLIDNQEIIDFYLAQTLDRVRCTTAVADCKHATLVFEAVIEEENLKSPLLRQVDQCSGHKAFFFTNTSSIPINILQEKSGLGERLIGFHFYNPPPIQRLVELIIPQKIDPQLQKEALDLARRLKKIVVTSNDIPGFIGNGHFIREIAFACQKVAEINKPDAIYYLNQISQEYLLRPMGIFQLIDYVGIDVCHHIAKVMEKYLPPNHFTTTLIEQMLSKNVKGGQHPDGSQKAGFFQYERGRPVAMFDLQKGDYITLPQLKFDLPAEYLPWKVLSKDPKRSDKIVNYFAVLSKLTNDETHLAFEIMQYSQIVAQKLVEDGVAHTIEDVNTVLQQGFYHLYDVQIPFLVKEAVYK